MKTSDAAWLSTSSAQVDFDLAEAVTHPPARKAHDETVGALETLKNAGDLRLEAIERRLGDEAALHDRIDRLDRRIEEQKNRLERMTIAENRPPLAAAARHGGVDMDMASHRRRVWDQLMRKGVADIASDVERKALSASVDADGGFLAPEETERTLAAMLGEASPFRALATLRSIGAGSYKKPVSLGGAGFGWVGETEARPKTTAPALAELEYPAMELYAMPAASSTLLDDAMVSIDQWLGEEIRGVFAEQETAAFVKGSGSAKPRGFLDYPTVADSSWAHGKIGYSPTGAAAGFKAAHPSDALIDLVYSLRPFYRHNARWMMNRKTLTAIRKFKDADGVYLWSPGQGPGQGSTLLGYPVVEIEDMPDIGAGAMAVAFGDFRAGYLIVDRVGLRVLRDPYSSKPYTLFYTTRRVGGGVQDFAAIKLLKFAVA